MNFKNLLLLLTLSLIVFSSNACSVSFSQAIQQRPQPPQLSPTLTPEQAKNLGLPPLQKQGEPDDGTSAYINEMRAKLYQEQFSWLEGEERKVQARKERLPGGYWKLNLFYSGVSNPEGEEGASDEVWQRHLALLRKWVTEQPQSLTAKVGLAEALINYGWKARGGGYANTVTDRGWALFEERLAEAEQLLEAGRAWATKSPQWYVSMLRIGQSTGWDAPRLNQLFDEAVKLEPDYYYFYRLKANHLLPRWHGEPGEWEKFAKETARKIGGDRGNILFFLIYTHMLTYRDLTIKFEEDDWPQLLAGFRALDKNFGSSPERLNGACFLAVMMRDHQVAKELFQRIGDQYNSAFWGSRKKFEMFRSWALNPDDKA